MPRLPVRALRAAMVPSWRETDTGRTGPSPGAWEVAMGPSLTKLLLLDGGDSPSGRVGGTSIAARVSRTSRSSAHRRGIRQGLCRDFHVCPREVPGTFRRASGEGPDSAERSKRAGQGLEPQHSMMFTASPPRAVSLYLTLMSAPVSFMVLMTLSRETLWLPSP